MTIQSNIFVKPFLPDTKRERYVQDVTFAELQNPEISRLSRRLDLNGIAPGLLMGTPEALQRGVRTQERINLNKRGINTGLCSCVH